MGNHVPKLACLCPGITYEFAACFEPSAGMHASVCLACSALRLMPSWAGPGLVFFSWSLNLASCSSNTLILSSTLHAGKRSKCSPCATESKHSFLQAFLMLRRCRKSDTSLGSHLSPLELILSVVSSMVGVGTLSFLAAPKMRRIAAVTGATPAGVTVRLTLGGCTNATWQYYKL